MAREIPLAKSAQKVIDANGYAEVELGPTQYGVTWFVNLAGVTVQPRPLTLEPECNLYKDGMFIGGTGSGGMDSMGPAQELSSGQKIKAVWTGGDPGKTAILTLGGTEKLPS